MVKQWVVRSHFYDSNDKTILIREQDVSEYDTLANCLRRHGEYAAKFADNRSIHNITIWFKIEVHAKVSVM